MKYESLISFSSIVIAKVKFTLDRQTDRQTDRVIPKYPQNFVCRGYNKASAVTGSFKLH